MNRPVASTSVVIRGAEITVGSNPCRTAASRDQAPTVLAHVQIARIVTRDARRQGDRRAPHQRAAEADAPEQDAEHEAAASSRATTRHASRGRTSPSGERADDRARPSASRRCRRCR